MIAFYLGVACRDEPEDVALGTKGSESTLRLEELVLEATGVRGWFSAPSVSPAARSCVPFARWPFSAAATYGT